MRSEVKTAIIDLAASLVTVSTAVFVFGPKSRYPWIAALTVSLLSTLSKTVKLMNVQHPANAPKKDSDRDGLHAAGLEYSVTTVAMVLQSTTNPQRWLLRLGCGHEAWIFSRRRPRAKTALCRECPIVGYIET